MLRVMLDTSIVRRCARFNDSDLELKMFRWGSTHYVVNWQHRIQPQRARDDEIKIISDIEHFRPILNASKRGEIELCYSPPVKFELGDRALLHLHNVILGYGESKVFETEGPIPQHWKPFYSSNISGVLPKEFNPIMTNSERKIALLKLVKNIDDSEFLELRNNTEEKHLIDTYIYWTAEQAKCDYLLSTDYKFMNYASRESAFNGFYCKVIRPTTLNDNCKFGQPEKDWIYELQSYVYQQRIYPYGTYIYDNPEIEVTLDSLLNMATFHPAQSKFAPIPTKLELHNAMLKCLDDKQ